MPGDEQAAALAWHALGGNGRIGYDIAGSDCILAVGANFLDSWGPVAHNRAVFNETHPNAEDASQAIYYAGAMQNNTAVIADLWLPVKTGTEEIFLGAVLSELIKTGVIADESLTALASRYSLEDAGKVCGTDIDAMKQLVSALKNASRPLVFAGTTDGQSQGTGVHMLAIAINAVLGRINQDGGMVSLPAGDPLLPSAQSLNDILERNFVSFSMQVASGTQEAPKLLFINDANPVYALSKDAKVEECFAKIAYKICFASHWNETCAECDLVLPIAHGLERFDDVYTPYGSGNINWTLAKPVTEPHYQARPLGELILSLADELGQDLGVRDIPALLEKRAQSLHINFKEYLESGETYQEAFHDFSVPMLNFMPLHSKQAKAPVSEIALLTYTNAAAGNPSTGIPPYANRAITDYQLADGLCVAQLNKATAQKLGLANGDKAMLETQNGKMPVRIKYYEGIMSDVIAVMAGLGHTEFDRFSAGKGNNILALTQIDMEAGSDLPVWLSTVTVVKG